MDQLRSLRKEHNWKQKDVADMLGIHVTTYTKYETGVSEPNHEMLLKLADIFDVSIDYLLERTNKKETPPTASGERMVPDGYDRLTSANRMIVDRLIADLAKSQSNQ